MEIRQDHWGSGPATIDTLKIIANVGCQRTNDEKPQVTKSPTLPMPLDYQKAISFCCFSDMGHLSAMQLRLPYYCGFPAVQFMNNVPAIKIADFLMVK